MFINVNVVLSDEEIDYQHSLKSRLKISTMKRLTSVFANDKTLEHLRVQQFEEELIINS